VWRVVTANVSVGADHADGVGSSLQRGGGLRGRTLANTSGRSVKKSGGRFGGRANGRLGVIFSVGRRVVAAVFGDAASSCS